MPSPSRPRRRLAPLLLAVVLAGELGAMAIGTRNASAGGYPARDSLPQAPVVAAAEPAEAQAAGPAGPAATTTRERPQRAARSLAETADAIAATVMPRDRPSIGRAAVVRPEIGAAASATTVVARPAPAYRGRNHLWIPALGIDRSVSAFPCSRTRAPDNYVYRWGCAGRNNVYLLGHAHNVFKRLHDAYLTGHLRKGMVAVYADGSGRIRTYAVVWWKTTRPTTSASWAWAAQSRPSMTLQTCVGSNNEYRLMVRLVATD